VVKVSTYQIQLSPRAFDQLKELPKKIGRQIASKIDALANDPRPKGCKKLEAAGSIYRIRSGDYRILYQIKDKALIVLIIRIGNRKDVYRHLER